MVVCHIAGFCHTSIDRAHDGTNFGILSLLISRFSHNIPEKLDTSNSKHGKGLTWLWIYNIYIYNVLQCIYVNNVCNYSRIYLCTVYIYTHIIRYQYPSLPILLSDISISWVLLIGHAFLHQCFHLTTLGIVKLMKPYEPLWNHMKPDMVERLDIDTSQQS